MRSTLLRAHASAAVLHGLLTLSAIISTTKDVQTVTVFESWPQWNYTKCKSAFGESSIGICPQTCPIEDPNANKVIGDVNMTAVLVISQLVTCLAHCMQVYWLYSKSSAYMEFTKKGLKPIFWLEYVITASAVAYVVIYYSGIIELKSQLVAVVSQSTLMLLGLLLEFARCISIEYKNSTKLIESRLMRHLCIPVFVIGFLNVLTVWFPSLYTLAQGDTGAPAWVFWIVLLEFMLYTSFGFSQLTFFIPFMIYGNSPTQSAILAENITMIVLSFVSKAILNSFFSICLVYGLCRD